MKRSLQHIALISAALAWMGCDPGQDDWPESDESFLFETTAGVDVGLQVVAAGAPLAGAHVTVRAAAPDAVVLWSGITDSRGRIEGGFARPQTLDEVDVIVKAPGYVGSCAAERCTPHGVFAPAAWLRLSPAELAGATVALERGTR